MDKYLKAIRDLEEEVALLESRKQMILKANEQKEKKEIGYQNKIENLTREVKLSKKRKHYLENKKKYQKKFCRKSILFGIKSASCFLLFLLGIPFVATHTLSASILSIFIRFLVIGLVLGLVEFRSVSREFFKLTSGITLEETNNLLEQQEKKIENIQKKRLVNKREITENKEILEEIEFVIDTLESQITNYRASRNALIENLIGNLDLYIPHFEIPQVDIHKWLEKNFIP